MTIYSEVLDWECTNKPILEGVVSHPIKNVNYICIVCIVVVCLFGLVESCDRDQGGGEVPVTLELFTSSLPSTISLSHLAVKWRNVFKASSSFTGALTTSSCADVAVCVCFRGHTACYCSWKTLLMEKCVAWSLILTARSRGKRKGQEE